MNNIDVETAAVSLRALRPEPGSGPSGLFWFFRIISQKRVSDVKRPLGVM